MTDERPWIAVEDVCESHYGISFETAKNQIYSGKFPVPTYKLGGKHVIDKMVHTEFFRVRREAGLLALKSTNG